MREGEDREGRNVDGEGEGRKRREWKEGESSRRGYGREKREREEKERKGREKREDREEM